MYDQVLNTNKKFIVCFKSITIEQVPKIENEQADALANLASTMPQSTCNITTDALS